MDMAVETYLLIPALRSFVHWKGGCLVSKSADIASGLFQRLFGRSDIGMDLWFLDLIHALKNPGHGKGSARAPGTEGKSRCGTGADPAHIVVPDVFPMIKGPVPGCFRLFLQRISWYLPQNQGAVSKP